MRPDVVQKANATLTVAKAPISDRINALSGWARDYIHHIETFVGAREVQELTQIRDERRALLKNIAELKAENRRLSRQLESLRKK